MLSGGRSRGHRRDGRFLRRSRTDDPVPQHPACPARASSRADCGLIRDRPGRRLPPPVIRPVPLVMSCREGAPCDPGRPVRHRLRHKGYQGVPSCNGGGTGDPRMRPRWGRRRSPHRRAGRRPWSGPHRGCRWR
nr:hypothetical protein PDK3.081 [Rhodococcus sp. DK17]